MKKAIGIDLGTTNSCVAVLEGGQPVIIPNAHGDRITPSVVSVNAAGQRLVGTPARRSAVIDAENTVLAIKRFMGRKFHEQQGVREQGFRVGSTVSGVKRFMGVKVYEPSVEQDRQFVPYRVDEAENSDVRVWLGDRSYSPPEISAMILRQLKEDAEAYLGEEITQAVITVPAYFNDSQRRATKDAGAMAGLEVLRILSEPTAAALAYGLNSGRNQTIAVYDLGGGTFDISILELCDGTFEVKAVNGDTHLGGDDIDRRIIEWLHRRLQKREGIDLRQDRIARQRLKDAAERAKIELTTSASTEVTLPFIAVGPAGPVHLRAVLIRSELEALASDIVERTIQCCRQVLEDARITPATLDQVVLVGGQTRMPLVQERVRQLFGEEPYRGLNPEEVVALGAAIQAGVLTGEIKDVLLLDVTPLTLSIETQGGVATPLIRRNSTIPTGTSQVFTTAEDDQPNVEIHAVQGERAMAVENKSLGRFCLEGLAPAPRGVPQIEVTFSIDADGILQVKARDRATGHQQQITVTADGALSEQEIERMKTEAKQFSQLDSQRRQEIRARNEADTCIHLAEETLKQDRDRLAAQAAEAVERQIAGLRAALQGGNVLRIATAARELQATLAEIMDQTAGPPPEVERIPRGLTRASLVPGPRDEPGELAESA